MRKFSNSSPFLTWYPLQDALDLLREAGYIQVEAHSDFTFQPATDKDTSFIVLGTKPDDREMSNV